MKVFLETHKMVWKQDSQDWDAGYARIRSALFDFLIKPGPDDLALRVTRSYSGLRWADPQPHERLAVLGIGGLGHLAVQYAKAAGFEPIAISHSPDKDKLIHELGADEIVRDGESLAAAGGADIILSTSNSTKSMAVSYTHLTLPTNREV